MRYTSTTSTWGLGVGRAGRDDPLGGGAVDAGREGYVSLSGAAPFSEAGEERAYPAASGAPYSITSSARARRVGGIVRPRAFAVLRLITSSNLVGSCTGRSAGLAPLRMRST